MGLFFGTVQSLKSEWSGWNGLLSYWNFNEGSGTLVEDKKGSIDGTLSLDNTWTASGKNNGGINYLSNSCSFGANYLFTKSQAYTVSCWIKTLTNPSSVMPILSNVTNTNTTGSIDVYMNAGKIQFALFYNNTSQRCYVYTTNQVINDTNFHHVVASYAGDANNANMKIYIDGTSVDLTYVTNTLTTTAALGDNLRTINRTATYNNTGTLDELAIWNRALSATEVSELYNAGTGLFY